MTDAMAEAVADVLCWIFSITREQLQEDYALCGD